MILLLQEKMESWCSALGKGTSALLKPVTHFHCFLQEQHFASDVFSIGNTRIYKCMHVFIHICIYICVCKHSYAVCCRMSDGGNMQITYIHTCYVIYYTEYVCVYMYLIYCYILHNMDIGIYIPTHIHIYTEYVVLTLN